MLTPVPGILTILVSIHVFNKSKGDLLIIMIINTTETLPFSLPLPLPFFRTIFQRSNHILGIFNKNASLLYNPSDFR